MAQIYYTAPSEEAFEDMKSAATEVWKSMDNTYGYVDEKLARVDVQNVQDNFMYILAMFDQGNQRKVISLLKESTKDAVRERMIDGGNDPLDIMRIGL